MKTLSFADFPVQNKKVLVRVDFNVPLDEEGQIRDDSRIRAALPTLNALLKRGAKVIAMSHLGEPKGKVVPNLSLAPVAERLSELLSCKVFFASDSIGPKVEELVAKLAPGELLLLENLRFHPGESSPDKEPSFAKSLASLGDYYVNDAFGTAHRPHSSVMLPQFFLSKAAPGLLMEKEIDHLGRILNTPKHPFHLLVGGAKVSTKIGVVKALIGNLDALLVGGAMANTLLAAQGKKMGSSLVEESAFPAAQEIVALCKQRSVPLLLPVDFICAESPDAPSKVITLEQGIPQGVQAFDIGPKTRQLFADKLAEAALVLWNGPLGFFEKKPFDAGTLEIAQKLASNQKAETVVGGGDTVAALEEADLLPKFTHVSTGGGACLEFLEKGTLPAVEALAK